MAVDLRGSVGAARIKRSGFPLRHLQDLSEHLARRSLIKFCCYPGLPDRLQETDRPQAGYLGGVFRNVETHPHVALGPEIINFIRLDRSDQLIQRAGIVQIPIDQPQPRIRHMRVLIDRVDPSRVEGAGSPDDAVDLIPFGEQQLSQVRSVLPCNPRNQCSFHAQLCLLK